MRGATGERGRRAENLVNCTHKNVGSNVQASVVVAEAAADRSVLFLGGTPLCRGQICGGQRGVCVSSEGG